MAFINISKVTLDNSEDGIKGVMGDVMLTCASIVHDVIAEKKYDKALEQIGMLKCSIKQLEYVLERDG